MTVSQKVLAVPPPPIVEQVVWDFPDGAKTIIKPNTKNGLTDKQYIFVDLNGKTQTKMTVSQKVLAVPPPPIVQQVCVCVIFQTERKSL